MSEKFKYGYNVTHLNNDFNNDIADGSQINTYQCDKWIIIDEVNLKKITINWNVVDVSKERELDLKEFIRASAGKGSVTEGVLYGREKTIKNKLSNFKAFLNCLDARFGKDKKISNLNLKNVRKILSDLITKGEGKIWSCGTAENYANEIKLSANYYERGLVTDGVNLHLPRTDLLAYLFKDFVESSGFEYHIWSQRGSWHNLPIDVALFVMNKQFELLESPITEFLIEYFDFQRSDKRIDINVIYKPGTFQKDFINKVVDVKCNTDAYKSNKDSSEYKLAKIFNKYGFIDKKGNVSSEFRPDMLYRGVARIKDAALFVFISLTGIRISEAASVKWGSFDTTADVIYFESALYKTNRGLPIKRSLSKHAYRAAEITARLSYMPLNSNSGIFSNTSHYVSMFYNKDGKTQDNPYIGSMAVRITNTYVSCMDKYGDNFLDYPCSTSPHALRHVFAALALRTFSGDVSNHIRRHFGHGLDSCFTKNYIQNKLDDAIVSATETEFFKNFVDNVGGGDIDFYSAVTKKIRENISECHSFSSISETSDFFEKETISVCEIIGHEFGYSVSFENDYKYLDKHHLTINSDVEDVVGRSRYRGVCRKWLCHNLV